MFDDAKQTALFSEYTHSRQAKSLAELKHEMNLDWLESKDYQIVNTPALLNWAIEKIAAAPIISVDTETTGLMIYNIPDESPIKDKIVGMSISWERDQGIYIPFRHVYIKNLDLKYALTALRPYLEGKSIITHNGLFDAKVFYDLGIKLHITQDTYLLHFNLDSTIGKGSRGLKALTHRRYGYDVIELADIFGSEKDAGLFAYVDEEVCKAYACADSDHTFMLFMDSFSDLLPGQRKAYQLDIRVQNELVRSEYNGKGIDMHLLKIMDEINNKDIATIEQLIYSYVGIYLSKMHNRLNYDCQYTFNISSSQDLQYVLFDLLKYPIPEESKGELNISVDKYTLQALDKMVTDEPDEIFSRLMPTDIMSDIVNHNLGVSDKDSILLSKSALEHKACKLAALITKHRKLTKLKTSFFAPIAHDFSEGRYFSGIKMARAETGRLVDFIQTLDKGLKKLVIPLHENDYLIDFDFAQIEARCMIGLSGMEELAKHLDEPEADYHREAGVLILGKPAEDITDSERKDLKSVNFGIPYSMTAFGILQNRYGIGLEKEERDKALAGIRDMLDKWNASMTPIKNMLNRYRDCALTPVIDSSLPYFLKGRKVGRIDNPLGRTRLFYLTNISKQKQASIRRQAGNFPIQSFAREIFCTAFCDLDDALKEANLIDIPTPDESKPLGFRFENKLSIMAYIHDECLISVDSSINPYFIYKLIHDCCMKQIKGHPTYYCGINVISNWYEGKSSKFEAPVKYVKQVIQGDVPIYRAPKSPAETRDEVLAGIREFSLSRVEEELAAISPRTKQHIYDLREIIPKFKAYAVKPLVETHLKLHRKPAKGDNSDYVTVSIETLIAYRKYQDNRFIDEQGNIYHLDVDTFDKITESTLQNIDKLEKEAISEEGFSSDLLGEDTVSANTFSKNLEILDTIYFGGNT